MNKFLFLLFISFNTSQTKQHILTYRNKPSYISMFILIFLSVRSNTETDSD